MTHEIPARWSLGVGQLLDRLETSRSGLSSLDAARRLQELGPDSFHVGRRLSRARVLRRQLRSPLLLLLVFAAVMALIYRARRLGQRASTNFFATTREIVPER